MTILNKMSTTSTLNPKHLSVQEQYLNSDSSQQRVRSERASSLALPHSSLLDFYDKEQEQCNSVALLPTNVNVVVRRHSSHYYPMLEEKQQLQLQHQQQQQQHPNPKLQRQPSLGTHVTKSTATAATATATGAMTTATTATLGSGIGIGVGGIITANSISLPSQHFHFNHKMNPTAHHHQHQQQQQHQSHHHQFLMQEMQSLGSLSTQSSLSTVVNNSEQQQQQQQQQQRQHSQYNALLESSKISLPEIHNNSSSSTTAITTTPATPSTPPPPIPKRNFRRKFIGNAWNPDSSINVTGNSGGAGCVESSSPTSASQTPTKGKQQQQTTSGIAFIYPQQQQQQQQQQLQSQAQGNQLQKQQQQHQNIFFPSNENPSTFNNSLSTTVSISPSFFVDITSSSSPRPSYTDSGVDAGGISDDDRMSLENSVFDESLTSTPVKVAAHHAKLGNPAFSAKSLAALTASDLSNAAKRSNRSSSSTVESSGYGSAHSERFASTSTTADFRSRFSSVDTQSSLDSCLTDKTSDSPLIKDCFKMDAMHEYNNSFNNNELLTSHEGVGNIVASNNNSLGRATTAQKLPAVPQRSKQYGLPPKIPPPNVQTQSSQSSLNNSSGNVSKTSSTVSASTSTSSTASAGSGMSTGSSMSISAATASNTAISPLTQPNNLIMQQQQQLLQQQKRPVPPAPPVRIQNSFDSVTSGSQADTSISSKPPAPPLALRNKLQKHKPPPIVYPKLHQRQDSNLSSDSFSVTSSPGYNSKNLMDAPLLQNAARINKSGPGIGMRHQDSNDSFGMTQSRYAFGGLGQPMVPPRSKPNYRQDSSLSCDSFSQTSSPGYNTKFMEAPLLPSLSVKRLCGVPAPIVCKQKLQNETIEELEQTVPISPLTKCVSTPASLQTIVRFQNGAPNTMSLQHQIINRRKSSNPYVTNGRLKFRLFQILLNAFALLAIAGGLAAYFNAYPTIKFVNKTIINTVHVEDSSSFSKNPAPGTCLPIIVKFCQGAQIPYNYTVFPNYIGHFGQLETQVDLDAYEALVDVRCYELVSLFLCTLFVPKCGSTGATVPPCKTLCTETMRRCGFFFDVFGLSLPEYLNCKLFKDFESPDDCVGLDQVRDVMIASSNPKCDGFQCDQNRCIPKDYVCDGHLDCMDQADEANCERCAKDEIYCGDDRCISSKHICDGITDCPYGQDERNCIRLSERNGDLGKGVLEVFRISSREWTPACVNNWDRAVSPSVVCSMLGYSSVNATSVVTQKTHRSLLTSVNVSTDIWKMYAKKRSTLMKEFSNCTRDEDYAIAELTCSNYECGKVKRGKQKVARRIIGGAQSNPGSWPFLAAILGGPEKIFYCAGVLISDQWVLTASHCIGNHTVIDLEDWTIQLGVTRRNSFTYSGQKVKVKTVIPHPQYNTAIAHDNDIALFQLSTRVAFHEHLLPVCLPPPGVKSLKPEQMCTVIGWGKREDKDPKSTYEPIVNEVQVPIIKRQQCDEWLDNLTVSDGMICAGYEEGGKDACQGDSGGPLLCPYPGEKNRWFVGGIVSWGIMCAHPKLPGVYANVIKYVPWILEQMQKHSKPANEEKFSKYDAHPGGPDILSNMSAGPVKSKKPFSDQNRSPEIDSFESYEKT